MALIKILMIMLILIFVLSILYYLFPICIVSGRSMHPTLKDGDILISTRLFKLNEGSVYIYERNDKFIIKRLNEIIQTRNKKQSFCYFLGDNPKESYDSRNYGYINGENIIAKELIVIKRNKKWR